MCIDSTPLNPNAQEWRPPQLHDTHLLYSATAAHQSQYFYLPIIVYHPPPVSFMATAPAAPSLQDVKSFTFGDESPFLLDSKKNGVGHPEDTMVKGRGVISKLRKPLLRLEWRPKKTVANGGAAASPPRDISPSKTTVMIRNIPNMFRREIMLDFLDSKCNVHSLEYDFLYLPMDFWRNNNLGYAFVNFTSGGGAMKFKKIMHNYKWGTVKTDNGGYYTCKKICAITWARIQGKDRLLHKFENSIFDCDNLEFLPVVFDPPRGGSNATSPEIVGRLGR